MIEFHEGERKCRACLKCKPLSMFSPNKKSRGGRLAKCKACRSVTEIAARRAKAPPKPVESPFAWGMPRDDRPASDKALDIELRLWPALAPANDLFWRIGA